MAPFAETPIFSFRDPSPVEVFKEPDLLDGWWTSDYLFSLERRAIFSRTWICATHRSRFIKPGDYISFELAGFPILIILGKDQIARAFHNVCRHRAYTITKKPAGSSLVLGCRYHGWSYDTKGNLVKAPHFDGVEGFDKSGNGLFKIQTCTDRAGFIHINLDAGDALHAPDLEKLVNFSGDYCISAENKWLTGWELNGAFNWKTIGASDRTGIGTESSSAAKTSIMEVILSMFRRPGFNFEGCHTFLAAPATIIFVFPKERIWATMTGLPVSAKQTSLKCDIFTSDAASLCPINEETLKTFFESRVQALEQHYSAIKFIRFEGIPEQLPALKAHLKLERLAGRELFPSKRNEGNSESFCKAEKLCNELDMLAKSTRLSVPARMDSVQGGLEW